MALILGSNSPRRKEILGYFSLPFVQASPDFDEDSIPFHGNPEDYVCQLSKSKADSLSTTFPDDIILTADTIVLRDGKIYDKPTSREEAFKSLSQLVGKWHSVYTGVTVAQGTTSYQLAEETRVLFNPFTSQEIDHYLSKTKWEDKAGGYGYQNEGCLIVRKIEGCYYNVIGLPINATATLLKRFRIHLI